MPMHHMKEIWTPFKLFRVKFFKSDEGSIYIKVGKQKRKKLNHKF
ncbi:hypothetical protein BTS2_1933 [Bacillus sp. TS-2]|nr:hypothetical protein BTS2_1933 [Bacillus sp. TS-2]